MRRYILTTLCLLLAMGTMVAQQMVSDRDSMAYAMGVANGAAFAQNLSQIPGGEVNKALLLKGFSEALLGEKTEISSAEAQEFLSAYFQRLKGQMDEENRIKNEAFLTENAKKKNIKTTESGLQYEILVEGKGPRPTVEDTVRVHYEGRLIDGTVFDSSRERGEPTKFGLLQVIPGWTEGLCLLPQGTRAKLYIPARLAYGDRGVGQMIPPYATLIFDIELLEVIPGAPIPIAESSKE